MVFHIKTFGTHTKGFRPDLGGYIQTSAYEVRLGQWPERPSPTLAAEIANHNREAVKVANAAMKRAR
jgi:hypothetical protein